jgi:hypothetical protein
MKRTVTTALLATVMVSGAALAQPATDFVVDRSRTSSVDYFVTNYGIFGQNVKAATSGFRYPRGTNMSYLFGSGLWFGAVKHDGDSARKLVFITYNMNSGASWATPGNFDTMTWDKYLYYSGDYDQTTGAFVGTGDAPAWSLWAMPGTDVNIARPGHYEADPSQRNTSGPYNRPAFMRNVSEQFVARYHDGDLDRYEGFGSEFGFPIGLQIQQNVYSWSTGDYGSAVVLQYEIVNVSGDTLVDCVVGQASDPDLGQANNDRVSVVRGSDGMVHAGVVYTDEETGGRYDALAQILLEAPSTGENGFILNSLRRELARQHEIQTFRNWMIESDPTTVIERYEFLYGPARDIDNGPGDKRTLLAGKPFTMAPGDTAHFAIAFAVVENPFGIARGGDFGKLASAGAPLAPSIDELTMALLGDFEAGQFSNAAPSGIGGDDATSAPVRIGPNPASTSSTLEFSLSVGADVEVSVLNAMGESVAVTSLGHRDPGTHRAAIDVADLAAGSYLVVVDAGTTRRTVKLSIVR